MDAPHLERRIGIGIALLLAVVLAALYALAATSLRVSERARLAGTLEADARRLADAVAAHWSAGAPAAPGDPCPDAGALHVRIDLADGTPACRPEAGADSADDADLAAARAAALAGRAVLDAEPGPADRLVATVPIRGGGRVVAAVQTVLRPLPPPAGLLRLRIAFAVAAGVLLFTLLAGVRLAGTALRQRLDESAATLRGLAAGALSAAAPDAAGGPPARRGFAPAAETLESTGAALQAHLERLTQRLDEREAVLASMVEGVLAVDSGGRVFNLNAAAGRMFAIEPAQARGRDLLEVVRHPELQRLVRDALGSASPVERELTLAGAEPRTLEAHGSALRDPRGRGLGTLVVLNDVTHLRRLERMRQDFVANVSHEIKTPITSIKGFVETLLDGALNDPATARRFLEIVARHADRLNAITEDLLNLSRIEQEAQRGALHTEEVGLADLLRGAAGLCAAKAEAKSIRVSLDCPPELSARLNPQLVEQALVNLLDNAVKYAPAGTEVRVEAQRDGAGIVLRVRDQGPGIPAEHLPRLFERFYRVDKARSRKAGGTGLGLAIVKHIAQAHGGRVDVESRLGAGSTFTLRLPALPPAAPPAA